MFADPCLARTEIRKVMNRLQFWIAAFSLLPAISLAQPRFVKPKDNVAKNEHITRKWLDIPYATVSPAQKLDIYLPEKGEGPFPVIISIHGGGFIGGDKGDRQVNPMLEGLERGYAVVAVNYRLLKDGFFPKGIHDVKAAIRWVRANATEYKFDPERIVAWGGSAGGNLAALAGTADNVPLLDDTTLGNGAYSSSVQVVIDWFGPTQLLPGNQKVAETGSQVQTAALNSVDPDSQAQKRKLGAMIDNVKRINPSLYVTENDPPFLIQHGSADPMVPLWHSLEFAEVLEKVLGKQNVTVHVMEGAKHGGPEFESKENLDRVFAFIEHYLRKLPSSSIVTN
jgi:acetyl esterase/lipase